MASQVDINGDELLDLLVHMATEALDPDRNRHGGCTGRPDFGGTLIRGSDSIRVVPDPANSLFATAIAADGRFGLGCAQPHRHALART